MTRGSLDSSRARSFSLRSATPLHLCTSSCMQPQQQLEEHSLHTSIALFRLQCGHFIRSVYNRYIR
jgi:hypothetical protein